MTDDFDELLEDVSEMENTIKAQNSRPKTEEKLPPPSTPDQLSIALETAKTAQEAAQKSQEIAENNLKLAEDLKQQERELSEANFNWRQSFRSSLSILKKTKGQFVVLMSITVITSMIAIGAMSFLYYSIQQKEQAFKGEILDMLQNEQALFNKNMTMKVDQLTAMMEMVQYQVEQSLMQKISQPSEPVSNPPKQNPGAISQNIEQAPLIDLANETEPTTQNDSEVKSEAEPTPPATPASQQSTEILSKTQFETLNTQLVSQLQTHHTELHENLTKLENRQRNILKMLDSLQTNQNKIIEVNQNQPKTASTVEPAALPKEQIQQIKNIHWWVSQHDKAIKRIEKNLKISSTSSKPTEKTQLTGIEQQLTKMQTQQSLIESQLEKLQGKVQQLIEKRAQEYRYQAK